MDNGESSYCRFLNGDEQGLEELIALYRHPLTYFINGFVKDMDLAEDLMIDTFAQLVHSKGQFRGDSSLKTYLFRIGRNKAIRSLKKNRANSTVSLEEIEKNTGIDCQAEDETLVNEQKLELRSAMEELSPMNRQVIYLLYFEDMSHKAAASVLKKSEKQIANAAYRAKKELRAILEKKGFEYHE